MLKESIRKIKPSRGHMRSKLIHDIIDHSETAHELFGIRVYQFEELYEMKADELRNLDVELRAQIGIRRSSFAH